MKSAAVYAAGLPVLAGLLYSGHYPYPLTGLVFYSLLSLLAVFLYVSVYLGGDTPSALILRSFSGKKIQPADSLTQLFTDQGLIWKRVGDLERARLITVSGDRYTVTPRGRSAARLAAVYRLVFHRPLPE